MYVVKNKHVIYPFWIYWTIHERQTACKNFYSSRHVRFYIYVHECVYFLCALLNEETVIIITTTEIFEYLHERMCVYLQIKNMKRKMCSLFICERNDVLLWVVLKFFLYKCFVVCYNCVFLWKNKTWWWRYNSVVVFVAQLSNFSKICDIFHCKI